ncbi:NAD(+) diphosphatase [Actinomadura sp. DC4]|uniref:NAD(+) diphosphatase n=1 Tax=Actinomadura sp. DC4 TaxID=3055069 RepID=UPI0025B00D67|nr:NAD(+) diphosphatase [Actinomadura sp. DC4]MDN3354830.1 NAD(+) diphosphatase [Actinomadura sp. DC4]
MITAPGLAPVGYTGLGLDRGGDQRADPSWVAGLAADPRAVVRPLWRDQCLTAGEPPVPLVVPAERVDPEDLVFLGSGDGVPTFAADLSDLSRDEALERVGADGTADIRALFAGLPAGEAATLAYARGLLFWHRRQRFCGCCGSAAERRNAGHLRVCTNPDCGTLLFPRIEPAVITLVETATEPRRCLLARHRASKLGGYSMLAGFVEIGESLEDAVHREILEEVGVPLRTVGYVGSQPWPFPAGIMIGFRATAADESVSVDGTEILEARWFTRGELRDYAESTGRLGRPDSIDRAMLTAWLAEGEETP